VTDNKCLKIINKFWDSSGYSKFETPNWMIIEQAMEYMYLTIKDNQEAAQAEKKFKEALNKSALKDNGKAVRAVARLRKEAAKGGMSDTCVTSQYRQDKQAQLPPRKSLKTIKKGDDEDDR
jgi:hypothetical protein